MNGDIFVIAEQRGTKLHKVGLELIGEAKKLAADLSCRVIGVLMGSDVAGQAGQLFEYGADRVVVAEHPLLEQYVTEPYTKALTAIIREMQPEIVLFGATTIGRDLAPRVAGRIHTGLTADCTALAIDPEEKLLLMTRPAFGGNLMATIVCRDYRPQMATVRPGVMRMPEPQPGKTGTAERFALSLTPDDLNVEIVRVSPNEKKSADITESKILVAGGRGVGGPEGYAPLRALADCLGGEVAASRMGVDSGWITKDRQVGQTGKTVRPALYIACGISGAIQHMAGMEESEFILAINKDITAPMMAAADLAVEGDLNEIIPKLTQAIEKRKAQRAM